MTNRQKRTTYLEELGPDELYRRGKDVVPGSELKIGETIVIDGWPYTIIEPGLIRRTWTGSGPREC